MLTIDSIYSLKRRGVLSLESNTFLYNLYLPLIGYKATFIYELLVNEYVSGNKEGNLRDLFKKSNLKTSEFIENKKSLESVGLIQTLENEKGFVFVLKAIKSPSEFFDNEVLKGLLVHKIGEANATKIMKLYEIDDVDFENYQDVTAGIKETFNIEFKASDVNLKQDLKLISKNKNESNVAFDDFKLIDYVIKHSNINIQDISTKEISEIHNLATIYGLNESIMGYILIDSYNDNLPKNHKIDLEYCDKRCKQEISLFKVYNKRNKKINLSGSTHIANLINYYENTTPRDFIKDKQGGVEPLMNELTLIKYLYENVGLSNGVINVILDYTLFRCDAKINQNFAKQVALTIKRKNLHDALEVYDLLFNKSKSSNKLVDNKQDEEFNLENIEEELESIL